MQPPTITVQPGATTTAVPSTPAVAASAVLHVVLISIAFASGWTNRADLVVQQGESAAPRREVVALKVAYQPPSDATRLQQAAAAAPKRQPITERPIEVAARFDPAEAELGELEPVEVMPPPTDATPSESESKGESASIDPPAEEDAAEPAAAAAPPQQEQRPPGVEKLGAAVDSLPTALESNQPPPFPAAAIVEKRSGVVYLTVHIDADGGAARVAVLRSSGHVDLDEAAEKAVRDWKFTPATRDGQPVAYDVAVPIRFVIE